MSTTSTQETSIKMIVKEYQLATSFLKAFPYLDLHGSAKQ
jgi:hypothetical protein